MSDRVTSTETSVPLASSPARRRLILFTCCSSVAVTGINLSMVNVALPSIRGELHASVGSLQWTVSAYSLAMACLLLLSGSIADRFGRRRVFQVGLLLFALGSSSAALAPGPGWLIASTALQGAGGSMLNPIALSIVVGAHPEPEQRARAIGVWGSTIGLTIALGPVLGGLLIDRFSWRSVFWVSVPIAVIALILTRLVVPESRAARARTFDLPGQALVALLLAAIVAATIEGPGWGWFDPRILTLLVLTAAALVALLVVESQRAEPLIDLRFFRSPPFAGAIVISVLMSACLGGFLFLNTLYLQETRGFSPLRAGLSILPLAAGQLGASVLAGRLVAARGTRGPLAAGGLLLTTGALLLIPLSTVTSLPHLLIAYGVFGCGVGLISPSITNTAVSGFPRDQVGVAGALAASARQFGASLGVAVVGAILTATTRDPTGSSSTAWTVLAACGVGTLVLGLVSTGRRARTAALRSGEHLLPAEEDRNGRA
jgi:EmrB/QacA subfamily drug resistance transporter